MRACVLAALLAIAACSPPQSAQPDELQQPPPVAFDGALATKAAARVGHGKRLAAVLGCTGCHGPELQGERFYEMYASNLTRDVPGYTDRQLEHVLREGVPPSGRELWGMPSELFQHLSAPDMTALIAFLRSLEPAGGPTQPPLPFPPDVKEMIAKGEIKHAAASVRETKSLAPVDLGESHALGRYITMVTCAECHGPELKGNAPNTPDLITAGAYSREQFERLMVEGIGSGRRKLKPLMEVVAKGRFSKMTPHERDALYAYLKARAEQPR